MKKNNYYKAAITLFAALAGFLASYPFRASFIGGLLSSGFSAALIGGLADWFAVTALFRRPLGIRPGRLIRTEIIPRNRERIFSALAGMVQNELLTPETLKKELDRYDLSRLLIRYLDDHGGQVQIQGAVTRLLKDLLGKTDPEAIGQLIEELLRQNTAELKIAPLAAQTIEFSLSQGYDDKVVDFIVDELIMLATHSQTKGILLQLVKQAQDAYEKGMDRRKLVNAFFIEPLTLAELAQEKLVQYLGEIRFSPTHPVRLKIKQAVGQTAVALQRETLVQRKLEAWKDRIITEKLQIGRYIAEYLQNRGYLEAPQSDKLLNQANSRLGSFLEDFKLDLARQGKLDCWLKGLIKKWIDAKQSTIGSIVKESLDHLTNDKLVGLIEEKAGNDLQMIRINGTVVGALAGMLIYLLTFWTA